MIEKALAIGGTCCLLVTLLLAGAFFVGMLRKNSP